MAENRTEQDGERGFTIVDRRGEGREEAPAAPAAGRELPGVDFSTFLLSLASSAFYHLGVIPDPETGKPREEPDLALARQTIDTLEMLQTKTLGNLDEEEAHLIESLLYELRMRFVHAKEKPEPAGSDAGAPMAK